MCCIYTSSLIPRALDLVFINSSVNKPDRIRSALIPLTLILGAAYSLWLVKRVIFGAVQNKNVDNLSDLNKREFFLMVLLSLFVLIIGLKPDLITTKMDVSVGRLIDQMEFGKDFSKIRPIESTNANEIFQTNLLPGTTE